MTETLIGQTHGYLRVLLLARKATDTAEQQAASRWRADGYRIIDYRDVGAEAVMYDVETGEDLARGQYDDDALWSSVGKVVHTDRVFDEAYHAVAEPEAPVGMPVKLAGSLQTLVDELEDDDAARLLAELSLDAR